MRKVKVGAAFLCLLIAGLCGGIANNGDGISVANTDCTAEIQEMTESAAATEASTVTTTETTVRSTTRTTEKTTAAETTKAEESTSTTTEASSVTTEATTLTETEIWTTEAVLTTEPTTAVTVSETTASTTTILTTITTTAAPCDDSYKGFGITEREYIMLCNVLGHEYGGDSIPTAEKALVIEVIMNRVASPLFPDSIYAVLTQPNQFSGLEYLIERETYSYFVTDDVRAAVDLYFSDPAQFSHGYLFFNGDGTQNFFRQSV